MKKKRCEACGWVHRKKGDKWTGGKPTCPGFTVAGKKV